MVAIGVILARMAINADFQPALLNDADISVLQLRVRAYK
jgi:hypothetical protein